MTTQASPVKTHIQACLNGSRERDVHPLLPTTPQALAEAAAAVVIEGARSVHVHPRGSDGRQSLEPEIIGAAVNAIRARCPGLPVGTSTAAWIEPDVARRLALVCAWVVRPDFASVNFSEAGAVELAHTLLGLGVQVEAGLSSAADARLLVESGLGPRCLRHLIEVEEQDASSALVSADAILAVLDSERLEVERLMHGFDAPCWVVLESALARGLSTRIGFEDTLNLADGLVARDNAELVRAAVALARGR